MKRGYLCVLMVLLLVLPLTFGFPLGLNDSVVLNAKSFLTGLQDSDGKVGGLSLSNWMTAAIFALNETADNWRQQGGSSIVEYIETHADELDNNSATDWARSVISIVSMGKDPHSFSGMDYIATLKGFHNNSQIGNPDLLNDDFWALIALCDASEGYSPEAEDAKAFILAHQGSDGGWSWQVGGASDVDDTAAAIMALIGAGENTTSEAILRALAYIKTQQADNGGFLSWGETNTDTDAWAICAIVAAGQDPTAPQWRSPLNHTPIDDLEHFQKPDGSFKYSDTFPDLSPGLNTAYALNALLGVPYSSISSPLRQVQVRIEGGSSQIFSGNVAIENSITVYDTLGDPHTIAFPSAIGAVDKASRVQGFQYEAEYNAGWDSLYIYSIAGEAASGAKGWMYLVNHNAPPMGADQYELLQGDEVLWYYGEWGLTETRINASAEYVNSSQNFTATVEYYGNGTWQKLAGAEVHFGGDTEITNSLGVAVFSGSTPGVYELYATKEGYIRSNRIQIHVLDSGTHNIDLEAEAMPSVAFEVTPSNIDFGRIGPGVNKSGGTIVLANTGSWDIVISATLNGDSLFTKSLHLDSKLWQDLSKLVSADPSDFWNGVSISSSLEIPLNYSGVGHKTATLTFWAQGIEP